MEDPMETTTKRRPGRPRGSRTIPRADVVTIRAACPRKGCHSTRLGDCTRTTIIEHAGTYQGTAFNRILIRYKRCLDCGQAVIDRSYEFWPDPPADSDPPNQQ